METCPIKAKIEEIAETNLKVVKHTATIKKSMDAALKIPNLFQEGFSYLGMIATSNICRGVMKLNLSVKEAELLMKTITHAVLADVELNRDKRLYTLQKACETCPRGKQESCEMGYTNDKDEVEESSFSGLN